MSGVLITPKWSTLQSESYRVTVRCPHCRTVGVLTPFGGVPDVVTDSGPNAQILGQRICPNPQCRRHVFFRQSLTDDALQTFPGERLDFDPKGVPASVCETLEEAITCYANGAYVAAAIMVRKTLEVLCADRGAKGDNLKVRIASLRQAIIVPVALQEGMDNLRLLGNDAAHVESTTFSQVGAIEVVISIEFTKELLKAAYQYQSLLEQLNSLKRDPGAN